jgi:DNA invertase Pin-like site-specific DNA recombinase
MSAGSAKKTTVFLALKTLPFFRPNRAKKLIPKIYVKLYHGIKFLSESNRMIIYIGYARVSKQDGSQSLDLQIDALRSFGVARDRIYQDLASGRKDSRPGLNACLKALQPTNVLTVWKLDRLGRDLKHLVNLLDELNQRKIGFKVLTGNGSQIDTTTPDGRFFFGMFAVLAHFERELISERTKAGLAAARARGRNGGRPQKMNLSNLKMAMNALKNKNTIATDVAKNLGLTTATLYSYVNGDGSVKEKGQRIIDQFN